MDLVPFFANWSSILSFAAALFAAVNTVLIRRNQKREQDRLSQKVKVRIQRKGTNDFFDLPGEIRRAEFTRAEVLGWIGMVPRIQSKKQSDNQPRFAIRFLNSADFFNRINQIQEGFEFTMLVVECSSQEYAQFDLTEIRKQAKSNAVAA